MNVVVLDSCHCFVRAVLDNKLPPAIRILNDI